MITVIWSIFGSIPQKTDGVGVLFPFGDYHEFSVQEVSSPTSGLIMNIVVNSGDNVHRGQIVAEIEPSDSAEQIDAIEVLQFQFDAMEEENKILTDLEAQSLSQLVEQNQREKQSLEDIIATKELNLEHLRTIAESKNLLSQRGVISVVDAVQSESTVSSAEVEINNYRHEITLQDHNYESTKLANEHLLSQRTYQAIQLQGRIKTMQSRLDDISLVLAPFDGRILQINVARGSSVIQGQKIALLEQGANRPLGVQGYVPVFTGKDIQPGMLVQISPTTVNREEYGFIKGTVKWISEYPSDQQTIETLIHNDDLVQLIVQHRSAIAGRN